MQPVQEINNPRPRRRASPRQRIVAGVVFAAVAGLFGFAHLAATGRIDLEQWLDPCGIKQRYGLPCPTCGMTTSALAFTQGRIIESFYIQPAAAFLCCIMVAAAFFAFLLAVFGIKFGFLDVLFSQVKIRHLLLALAIVIAAGWAVTLARALAARGHG